MHETSAPLFYGFHISREYANGIGHVDARNGQYLLTFFGSAGHRVLQAWTTTLQEARWTLRRMANNA